MSHLIFKIRFSVALCIAAYFFVPTFALAVFSPAVDTPKEQEITKTTVTVIPKNTKSIILVLPHQDDELFMAGAIQQYVKTERKVYAVIVSDGGGSHTRSVLNGHDDQGKKVFCKLHQTVHNPKREGYRELTRQAFSHARNKEFLRSVQILGIPSHRVIFMNGTIHGTSQPEYKDGDLPNTAQKAIDTIYKRFGDGTYVTVSGGHPDHVALEEALIAQKGISEKAFFPLEHNENHARVALTPEELKKKQKAVDVYKTWKPKSGMYAVGQHSVPDLIAHWRVTHSEPYYSLVQPH